MALIYHNAKLSHSGVTVYKSFEDINRKIHHNSLNNLLQNKETSLQLLVKYTSFYKFVKSEESKKIIDKWASEQLFENEYQEYLRISRGLRKLSPIQSRRLKKLANKLCYYSSERTFSSKKSGKYKFKVAFLTLTAPALASNIQINNAFNHFLDYIRRTANCVYVWKKEMGEKNGKFHIHLMINNFIPYYIVDWKWKRTLIAEGVEWPINDKGKHTSSHYRIELPRNKKHTAHYISKYLSKAYEIPKELGYISGHSNILDDCKELILIEGEFDNDELRNIRIKHKVIEDQFITHFCVNLMKVKEIAPKLFAVFEVMFKDFNSKITLHQKFHYV